ncbi:MAG: monovalent cation/H(+) antiporter subunit G [Halobacteria archaeon]
MISFLPPGLFPLSSPGTFEGVGILTPTGLVVAVLVVTGMFFLFAGTYGVLVMPDVYNRMHATSKATTLGATSLLLANSIYYGWAGDLSTAFNAVIGIFFLYLTVPTGAHIISRSAHRMGVEFYGDAEWPEEEQSHDSEE